MLGHSLKSLRDRDFRNSFPTREQVTMLEGRLDWQAGVYVPLSWDDRVIGLFGMYLL